MQTIAEYQACSPDWQKWEGLVRSAQCSPGCGAAIPPTAGGSESVQTVWKAVSALPVKVGTCTDYEAAILLLSTRPSQTSAWVQVETGNRSADRSTNSNSSPIEASAVNGWSVSKHG